jgi:hypothetical protein
MRTRVADGWERRSGLIRRAQRWWNVARGEAGGDGIYGAATAARKGARATPRHAGAEAGEEREREREGERERQRRWHGERDGEGEDGDGAESRPDPSRSKEGESRERSHK